ncbi:hypothetical protein MTsPCn9_10420 [Croceitalea sp. MTPC9]|uniref:phospholipase D-like domain-containing protein n=1 Tax=unclassified Croceitalea TaxID=2632280 RepID=UPI002B371CA1|nr:hypothetical protein MTsPCn6_26820 [Croceitalea sp. MTPC6]GMN16106.1 hypothetical protein MTsPCn9_10420 [Croceitalea sp. MTPC9]
MYFNNAQCDIYIGTGAGKKLMEEMTLARKSVKIVSPFLSAPLLEGLNELHQKGVKVELITTADDDQRYGKLQNLIRQNVHIDGRARKQRKRLKIAVWGCYAMVGMGLVASWWFFIQQALQPVLVSLALTTLAGLGAWLFRFLVRNKRVYSYTYEPIFPLKVVPQTNTFGQRTTYLHSKIYIIDDRIAYLGSLNFTRSGTEHNYETRVRLTDGPSVHKIVEEFRYLMDEASFPELDVQLFGKSHFKEIIN